MPVDVPIYDDGEPTGRRLELITLEVCRRVGCGCVWEEVQAYVPEGWDPPTSAAVRIKERDERRKIEWPP